MTAHPKIGRGVLSTDAYQVTMAQLYFRMGLHERTARFEHFYRSNPDYGEHQAGYCVAAGLGPFVDWTGGDARRRRRGRRARARTPGGPGERLFDDAFCDWFGDVDFSGAAAGGRARGASRASEHADHRRRRSARRGAADRDAAAEPAQLPDADRDQGVARGRGGTGSAGARVRDAARARRRCRRRFTGCPDRRRGRHLERRRGRTGSGSTPSGTHAHSMVQLFMALGDGELGAFEAYADVYPDDCLLLVDTVDTLESGVPNAIRVFERLRRDGHEPVGVRLDSGDLAYLAVRAARLLEQARVRRRVDRAVERPRRAADLADPPTDHRRGAARRMSMPIT